MKKLLSSILSLAMLLALTVPAFAHDSQSSAATDSYAATSETQQKTMLLDFESFNLQDVGDTYILEEDEDGILYIELTDCIETVSNISRAGTTVNTTRSYNFMHKNWLGQESVAVVISAKVTWISNGANSYIQNLHGEYSIVNNAYSCTWDDAFKTGTDDWCTLVLDINNSTTTYSFLISAALVYADTECTVPVVNLDIGEF